jgi:hypothetical protein
MLEGLSLRLGVALDEDAAHDRREPYSIQPRHPAAASARAVCSLSRKAPGSAGNKGETMIDNLEEMGREKLRELLAQCTESQVAMFNSMYESVDVIPQDKINWAIQQCERTIAKNEKC